MRTLLRHTRTGLYYQGSGNWTEDPEQAYDFRFIDRAVQYVELWELTEVELAFVFEDPASVSTVPLERTTARYSLS